MKTRAPLAALAVVLSAIILACGGGSESINPVPIAVAGSGGQDAGSDAGASGTAGSSGADAADGAAGACVAGDPGAGTLKGECFKSWCWENPLPSGEGISSVLGFNSADMWAVGGNGLAEHWDGTAWKPVPTGTTDSLDGLKGTSTDLWAFAGNGFWNSGLMHWDGEAWTAIGVELHPTNIGIRLTSVNGTTWVVDGKDILHWTGSAFVSEFAHSGAAKGIVAVSGSEAWAVGDAPLGSIVDGAAVTTSPWIAHRTDSGWAEWPLPSAISQTDGVLYDAWASGPGDVWAFGSRVEGSSPHPNCKWVLHFDGSEWSEMPCECQPADTGLGPFLSQGATEDAWVFACGQLRWGGKSPANSMPRESFARYFATCGPGDSGAGITLSCNDVFFCKNQVMAGGAWASSPSDAWAVAGGALAHWDGTIWSPRTHTSTNGALQRAWGSSDSDIWLVGFSGTVEGSDLVHWDGSTWTAQQVPEYLHGVFGTAPDDVWAVGLEGKARHWNGSSWSPVQLPTTAELVAVWSSAANDVWVVAGNAVFHWDGSQWAEDDSFGGNAIWGSSSTDVWIVAGTHDYNQSGETHHWDGSSWSTVAPPNDNALWSVWGVGKQDVWAAGSDILRWDGSSWQVVDSPGFTPQGFLLPGLWGSGPNDVWAVGCSGSDSPSCSARHWDGLSWSSVSDWWRWATGVWGSSASNVYAFGEGGRILHRKQSTCPNVCDGRCADTSREMNNCGSCGHECADGEICKAGVCTPCADACGPLEECRKGRCVARSVPIAEGSFSIDATEVTRDQYAAWLPGSAAQDPYCGSNTDFTPVCEWPPGTKGNHPVVCVDWCDASAYCKAVGKRLCGKIGGGSNGYDDQANASLSQWYGACSSGGLNDYPYADTYDGQKCNGGDKPLHTTVPVAASSGCTSTVTGYTGVYDLSGNAWEWEDSCKGPVPRFCRVRGGSYQASDADDLRCASNKSQFLGHHGSAYGFRCCSDL